MRKIKPTTKRKIAGIVAVVLIVAMILSAVLPLFLRTAYAQEAQQFTVETRVGFNGTVKMNGSAPVEIKITNKGGKKFKGKVTLKPKKTPFDIASYSEDEKEDAEYYADIELSPGETKLIKGRIAIGAVIDDLSVVMTDNRGKSVCETECQLLTDKDDMLWLGVMSDSERTRNMISANFGEFSQIYGVSRVVDVSADNMDQLKNVDMLIINDFDMDGLSEDDIAKLRARAENGALVVIGTKGGYEEKQWFKTLTADTRENQYSSSAALSMGKNSSDAYDFAISTIENSSVDDEGRGKLTYLCQFLSEEELIKLTSLMYFYEDARAETAQYIADNIYMGGSGFEYTNDAKTFIAELYDEAKNDTEFIHYDYAAHYQFESDDSAAHTDDDAWTDIDISCYTAGQGAIFLMPNDALAAEPVVLGNVPNTKNNGSNNLNDFDLEKPAEILGSVFLAVIMMYAIFIGPFLFLILKKRDKREKAVKYIPVSALALTAMIIVCSLGSKFQRPLANVVNIVQSGASGLRQAASVMIVSSPTKGKVNIKAEQIKNSLPLSEHSWDGVYDHEGFSASLTDFNYTYRDQRKWATKKYEFNGEIELNGALDVKVKDYFAMDKKVELEITNNTGYDLEDVCAAGRGNFRYNTRLLKKLKNGETQTCTVYLSDAPNYGAFGRSTDTDRGYSTMTANKISAAESLINEKMLVLGYIKSNTSGDIKINGRKASKTEITAIYTYIDASDEYDFITMGEVR